MVRFVGKEVKHVARRKNDGAQAFGTLFVLGIVLTIVISIMRYVWEHFWFFLLLALIIIISVVQFKRYKRKKDEELRLQFKNKYGYDKSVYDLMQLVNQLFDLEKRKLSPSEKQLKSQLKINYQQLLNQIGFGYVYFVREQATGTVKIGKANDPYQRIVKGFGVKFPYKLDVVYLIKSNNDYLLESHFHAIFDSKRINGEWFELTDEDVAWIQSRDYSLEMLQLLGD